MFPCINGLKKIPFRPSIFFGCTPNELKLYPKRTSAQNTIQIKSTNSNGYPIVEALKINFSVFMALFPKLKSKSFPKDTKITYCQYKILLLQHE